MAQSRIRFVGTRNHYYCLKLGPIEGRDPPTREFRGGDEALVRLQPSRYGVDCVDVSFDDGAFAIEVSSEYFTIIDESPTASAS